jgi:hypothetical protein
MQQLSAAKPMNIVGNGNYNCAQTTRALPALLDVSKISTTRTENGQIFYRCQHHSIVNGGNKYSSPLFVWLWMMLCVAFCSLSLFIFAYRAHILLLFLQSMVDAIDSNVPDSSV